MVGAQLFRAQFQRALVLADGESKLAQVQIGRSQRVANRGLDFGLCGEIGGDARLGCIDRLAQRHLTPQASVLARVARSGQHLVSKELQHRLGLDSSLVWPSLPRASRERPARC